MPIMAFISLIFLGIYFNKKKVVYFTLVIFYIISTPFFTEHFFKTVEGQYNPTPLEVINRADAIVVLSGILKINEFGNHHNVEWGDADRFFGGIELYEAKKSNVIVFTGAQNPYNRTKLSEGEILKKYAIKYGVTAEDIFVTGEALNTFEESAAVLDLLGENKNIILVTSAFHMKRAKGLFEKKGFNVTAFKVDYKTPPVVKLNFIDFLPNANSLSITEIGFRELLGRLYYGLF
jgi:uncharacterized SAM-binding protein YcdF (DUF218 family)